MAKQPEKTSSSQSIDASSELRIAAYKKRIIQIETERFNLEAENVQLHARIKLLEKNPNAEKDLMSEAQILDQIKKIIGENPDLKKTIIEFCRVRT